MADLAIRARASAPRRHRAGGFGIGPRGAQTNTPEFPPGSIWHPLDMQHEILILLLTPHDPFRMSGTDQQAVLDAPRVFAVLTLIQPDRSFPLNSSRNSGTGPPPARRTPAAKSSPATTENGRKSLHVLFQPPELVDRTSIGRTVDKLKSGFYGA